MITEQQRDSIELPPPGIYERVPFAVYRSWPAVNKSSLDDIEERSPIHCKYRQTNPEPETPELRLGRAYHTLVLEPNLFAEEFVIGPDVGKTAKAWKEFEATAPAGKSVLHPDEETLAKTLAAATWENESCRRFIESDGRNELSLLWQDADTGLVCKARIDLERPSYGAIGDLKTTRCASPVEFQRSIASYGYHRQAAFYLDGAKSLGLPSDLFAFICQEKEPPYAVATYQIDDHALEVGRIQNRRLLNIYTQCMRSGVWYGYGSEFALISVPQWETKKVLLQQQF